jgi:hypothetical protein
VLIHSLRENTLVRTELAKAQPVPIILQLFKLAVRVIQYMTESGCLCPVRNQRQL